MRAPLRPAGMTYLTGASTAEDRADPRWDLGLLRQPRCSMAKRVGEYPVSALDNGAFGAWLRKVPFDTGHWWRWLEGCETSGVLFATAPDVVGDAKATETASRPWLERIRELGLPVAYVGQNGFEPRRFAWSSCDVFFIGGDTAWKLGPVARLATAIAKEHGKHVHMGRANSEKRLRAAAAFGCDSADGTFLKFAPATNKPRLYGWLDSLNGRPFLPWGGIEAVA